MHNYSGELIVDINNELESSANTSFTPSEVQLKQWIGSCLSAALSSESHYQREAEISISIVNEASIRQLNHDYRNKDKSTNVLSFPTDFPEELELPLLGDVIICNSVLEQEAQEQNKSLEAHWAHLCIHGCLHLLGFDHIEEQEAEIMEGLETKIMLDLNYPAPYL